MPADQTPSGVASPCVHLCRLDGEGVCRGCWRTIDEIADWGMASDEARRAVLRAVDRRREERGR